MPAAEATESSDTRSGLPGLSPASRAPVLVRAPLPAAGAARGRLVAGFPSVLRPPGGASVTTSSVAGADRRLQVALVGAVPASPEQVLSAYRERLSALGMREQASPAVPGSLAAAFVRGGSTVTVTVAREGARTSFTVYGALRAGTE